MWPNSQETTNLVTFTECILNGKHFLCSVTWVLQINDFGNRRAKEKWINKEIIKQKKTWT